MIKLKDILKEAKQVGLLYHYTSKSGLKSILDSDELDASSDIKVMNYTLYRLLVIKTFIKKDLISMLRLTIE